MTRGERGEHDIDGVALIEDPPLLDDALYDAVRTTPESEAKRYAKLLATREGVFAGGSAGLNVASAIAVAKNRSPDAAVVTVACDTGLKYLQDGLFAAE
jgi:cysteine synthase A